MLLGYGPEDGEPRSPALQPVTVVFQPSSTSPSPASVSSSSSSSASSSATASTYSPSSQETLVERPCLHTTKSHLERNPPRTASPDSAPESIELELSQGNVVLLNSLDPNRPDIARSAGHKSFCLEPDLELVPERTAPPKRTAGSYTPLTTPSRSSSSSPDGSMSVQVHSRPTGLHIMPPHPGSEPWPGSRLPPLQTVSASSRRSSGSPPALASPYSTSSFTLPQGRSREVATRDNNPGIRKFDDFASGGHAVETQPDAQQHGMRFSPERRAEAVSREPSLSTFDRAPMINRPVWDSPASSSSTTSMSPRLQRHAILNSHRQSDHTLRPIQQVPPPTDPSSARNSPLSSRDNVSLPSVSHILDEVFQDSYDRPREASVSSHASSSYLGPTSAKSIPTPTSAASTQATSLSSASRYSNFSPPQLSNDSMYSGYEDGHRSSRPSTSQLPRANAYSMSPYQSQARPPSSSSRVHASTPSSARSPPQLSNRSPSSNWSPRGQDYSHEASGSSKILSDSVASGGSAAPLAHQPQYKCTEPGCKAAPFATQYLLNSHANVHSNERPHYCPVPNCPRSKGGKGFKRKNEMVRHGLVHDSPGYVCPFCPDREHRYPRPDNLQRHVRMHHDDCDPNDSRLREVLDQKRIGPNEDGSGGVSGTGSGHGRGRRKRTA